MTPPTSPLSAGHSSPPSHGNLPKLSRSKTLFRGATLTDSEVMSVLASSKEGTAMPMELDGAGAKVHYYEIYVCVTNIYFLNFCH